MKTETSLKTSATSKNSGTTYSGITSKGLTVAFLHVSSKTGKKILSVIMFVLLFIPIMLLVSQSALTIQDTTVRREQIMAIDEQMLETTDLVEFISNLQRERLMMSYYLLSLIYVNTFNDDNAETTFANTDKALADLRQWRTFEGSKMFSSKIRFQIRLDDFRSRLRNANGSQIYDGTLIEEILSFYNTASDKFLTSLSNSIQLRTNSNSWRYLLSFKNLLRGLENSGIATIYCLYFYGSGGGMTDLKLIKYLQYETLGSEYLRQARDLTPYVDDMLKDVEATSFWSIYEQCNNDISSRKDKKNDTVQSDKNVASFYTAATNLTNSLRVVQKRIRNDIRRVTLEEVNETIQKQIIAILALALVMGTAPLLVAMIRNGNNTLSLFINSIEKKAKDLNRERKRSQKLLYKMLPPMVVDQLQSKKIAAERFESVTILFSKLAGFDKLAQTRSAMESVSLLNMIHKITDRSIDQYDVYKVETIRDQYMVASGVPKRNGDEHAVEISKMALALRETLNKMKSFNENGLKIQCGIHSGSCVAGVVGTKMPRYCLFGDTVNTASRMESRGQPDKIHVSNDTYMILSTIGGFSLELRGTIEVKGKGELETYWLISSKHIHDIMVVMETEDAVTTLDDLLK